MSELRDNTNNVIAKDTATQKVRKEKKTTIGGQALIEGLMMCGPHRTAMAIRKADGSIYVEEIKKSTREAFLEKVPIVRGCIRFFRQLVTGTGAMMKSAEISEEGDPVTEASVAEMDQMHSNSTSDSAEGVDAISALPEMKEITDAADTSSEDVASAANNNANADAKKASSSKEPKKPSRMDAWLDKHMNVAMVISAIIGICFSVALFIVLPRLIVDTVLYFVDSQRSDSVGLNILLNLAEGAIRITIFVIYLSATSRIKDIARVWMYHGAEHKTIACYEAGEPLTVENIKKHSRFHPRCGTAFMFIVLIVSILVFSLANVVIGVNVWWVNALVRIALVPLVGGISFELLRLAGRHEKNPVCHVFTMPGLWLQRFTTREPNDSMMEVAIAAMQAVIPENEEEDIW